jgi:hypothetical protein
MTVDPASWGSGTVATNSTTGTIHYTTYPNGGYITPSGGIVAGGGGGSSINHPWINTAVTFPLTVHPDAQTLSVHPEVMEKLISKMITVCKEGEPLVICVDADFTPQQLSELTEHLTSNGIKGVLIAGARAGHGPAIYRPIKPGHERIDILGRLAEIWERKPDLNLAELLAWWDGSNMNDDDFAAATDVHFSKIYEDRW